MFLKLVSVSKHFPLQGGWFSKEQVFKAVDRVDLEVKKGEILGLVGESGCGKSTLSRTIMQLIPITAGQVFLEGEELTALPFQEVRARRIDFQMIFQDPYASLNPRMTVFSTLAEAVQTRRPNLANQELADHVAALLERVGLDRQFVRRYPHEFSGGQRQRIAIARALATEPKLIIADEPVSALDVSIQSQILNLLKDLQRDLGLTMIFISHDLSVIRYIADRVAVMHEGKIIEMGDAETIIDSPQEEYTRNLVASIPRLAFEGPSKETVAPELADNYEVS